MDTGPILTIAIPSYNRFGNLKFLSDKIIPFLNEQLYLLVVDNCSSDNEYKSFDKLAKSNPHFSYVKNITNLGGTVNMLRCVELSTGRYTWLLGDDDDINVELLPELVMQLSDEKSFGLHVVPRSRKHKKIDRRSFHDIINFTEHFYDVAAFNILATNIVRTKEAQQCLVDAYQIVHLQHAFSIFFARFLENGSEVKILNLQLLENEQATHKRWSKFSAHIDAMETSRVLYGKNIIQREFDNRSKQLLRIALMALFSEKDEGFNFQELKRLYQLLGFNKILFLTYLTTLISMSKTNPTRHVIVLFLILIFYLKFPGRYKQKLTSYLSIEYKDNLFGYLHERMAYPKKGYFKN